MKKPLLFSRLLQFAIVFSFLLPFFFVGCEDKTDESAATTDSTFADTTFVSPTDTLKNTADTLSLKNNSSSSNTDTTNKSIVATTSAPQGNDEKRLSKSLCKDYPWLAPILIHDESIFTGLALVIDDAAFLFIGAILYALISIVTCLLIKYLDPTAIRTQLLHNTVALVALHFYIPGFNYEEKWGYWVCIVLLFIAIAIDVYRLIQNRSKKLY